MAKIAIQDIVNSLKEMSLIEIKDLVSEIEKVFEISATAPVAAASDSKTGDSEPTEVNLILKEVGGNKVAVIKVAKEVLGLGLMDAKKFVESAPSPIKEGIKPAEAEELSAKFKEAGATTEIK